MLHYAFSLKVLASIPRKVPASERVSLCYIALFWWSKGSKYHVISAVFQFINNGRLQPIIVPRSVGFLFQFVFDFLFFLICLIVVFGFYLSSSKIAGNFLCESSGYSGPICFNQCISFILSCPCFCYRFF